MGGAQVQALIGAWKQIVGHTPRRGVYGRGHERYGGDHHPYFGGGEEVIDASVQPYDGGDQVVTSSVTKDAALDLGLKVGQAATVFIKSTAVTIGVE